MAEMVCVNQSLPQLIKYSGEHNERTFEDLSGNDQLELTSAEGVGFVPYKELQLENAIVYFLLFCMIVC